MTYTFTVSPDIALERLPGWQGFNTWLQEALGAAVHLALFPDFTAQRKAIAVDRLDLIYANPYDASMLVREKGFIPMTRPQGKTDEALVAVSAGREISVAEDLRPGISVATTNAPDIHMMGMIMLEPANLHAGNVSLEICDSTTLAAKRILEGQCDAGIFLAEAFRGLPSIVRDQLRVLVSSEIQVLHHSLMLGPRLAGHGDRLHAALLAMSQDEKGRAVLEGLGFRQWEPVDQEAMEFMIDLMDTLLV